jgi:hypothetical protein
VKTDFSNWNANAHVLLASVSFSKVMRILLYDDRQDCTTREASVHWAAFA